MVTHIQGASSETWCRAAAVTAATAVTARRRRRGTWRRPWPTQPQPQLRVPMLALPTLRPKAATRKHCGTGASRTDTSTTRTRCARACARTRVCGRVTAITSNAVLSQVCTIRTFILVVVHPYVRPAQNPVMPFALRNVAVLTCDFGTIVSMSIHPPCHPNALPPVL